MDTPTVGRIVRYVLPPGGEFAGQDRAAIVTGVFNDYLCNLTVFYDQPNDVVGEQRDDTQMVGRAWSCQFNEEKAPGTWHWPERV